MFGMFKNRVEDEPMEMDSEIYLDYTPSPVIPDLTLEESFDLVLDRLDTIESKLDILIEKI